MHLFSQTITDNWKSQFLNGDVIYSNGIFTVTINPDLSEDSRVMVLETTDGRVLAVLTPEMADKLDLSKGQELSELDFRQKLNEGGVTLHGADYLFYFSKTEKNVLLQENQEGTLRQLTEQDDLIFSEFESSASEQDLDDAYVELDHWAVFGSFEQNRLVCAASMYPWEEDVQIADLGVLTLTSFRGKGHARKVVRSICKYAFEQGYEPQYRCQLDNEASMFLAKAAGLTLFGKWDVISPDCTVGESQ
ncbi:GNAT family N-acetyltransferase [Lysinibacillus agricola]|uniref:GNAT family N-acetyltransferase n=1 Tax=Lysinibacillus agricola TaxID=2590012 RepID=A0ABX7AXF1_9BACI|nr:MULTISPECIES: GNAT family N-acetyltransferase [Lysinibacillus]KOS60254.1 acetyltransferase [Lysinibacillus sp. FJAT-14222]QQP14544.1 GNAT family N-acetyltransferase [Lysinibacillus agricola]